MVQYNDECNRDSYPTYEPLYQQRTPSVSHGFSFAFLPSFSVQFFQAVSHAFHAYVSSLLLCAPNQLHWAWKNLTKIHCTIESRKQNQNHMVKQTYSHIKRRISWFGISNDNKPAYTALKWQKLKFFHFNNTFCLCGEIFRWINAFLKT